MKPAEEPVPDEEAPQDCDRSNRLGMLWFVIAALLLAYPLSVGPVAKFYQGRTSGPKGVEAFYVPLIWLCSKSEPLSECIGWYLEKVWRL